MNYEIYYPYIDGLLQDTQRTLMVTTALLTAEQLNVVTDNPAFENCATLLPDVISIIKNVKFFVTPFKVNSSGQFSPF